MKLLLCIAAIILTIFKYLYIDFQDYRILVDNEQYFNLFNHYKNSDLRQLLFDQFSFIGAVEPITAFIFFINARYIPLNFIPLFLTCIIYVLLIINTKKINYIFLFYILFSFVGFYEFILFDVTHRLKIAFLVLLICITFTKSITNYILPVILCHASTILIFVPLFYKIKKKFTFIIIPSLILLLLIFELDLFYQFIYNKVNYFKLDFKILISSLLFLPFLFIVLIKYNKSVYLRALITIFLILFILYLIGRSRYFMLLYFTFIISYFVYGIKWPKLKPYNLRISDLVFFSFIMISLIKSYDVLLFYFSGKFFM